MHEPSGLGFWLMKFGSLWCLTCSGCFLQGIAEQSAASWPRQVRPKSASVESAVDFFFSRVEDPVMLTRKFRMLIEHDWTLGSMCSGTDGERVPLRCIAEFTMSVQITEAVPKNIPRMPDVFRHLFSVEVTHTLHCVRFVFLYSLNRYWLPTPHSRHGICFFE